MIHAEWIARADFANRVGVEKDRATPSQCGRQLRRPTGDKMTDVPFKVGDRVKKRSGYEYPGFIVSVFTNRAGAVRYVVEADHPAFSGMLHIFNGDQLEHR